MDYPIELRQAAKLKPDPRNSRTHDAEQLALIKRLMLTVGFTQPILVGKGQKIIAGHGRVLAALEIYSEGLEIPLPNGKGNLPAGMVPVVDGSGMSEEERRAYVIADNQSAQLSGWDEKILGQELEELKGLDFDISLTGFQPVEVSSFIRIGQGQEDAPYTRKIQAPTYEPKGEKPAAADLCDRTKVIELQKDLHSAEIPDEVKSFLLAAAERHTRFDFEAIAEFYAHASPEIQRLMEESALVIIDFDQAVEQGFVRLSEELEESYRQDYEGSE